MKKGERIDVRSPVGQRQWTSRDGTECSDTTVMAWVLHLHWRSRQSNGEEGRERSRSLARIHCRNVEDQP